MYKSADDFSFSITITKKSAKNLSKQDFISKCIFKHTK